MGCMYAWIDRLTVMECVVLWKECVCVCVCWWDGSVSKFVHFRYAHIASHHKPKSLTRSLYAFSASGPIHQSIHKAMHESIDRSFSKSRGVGSIWILGHGTNRRMNHWTKQWINESIDVSGQALPTIRTAYQFNSESEQNKNGSFFLPRIKRRVWYVLLHYVGVHACNAIQNTPKQGDFIHEYGTANTSSERANERTNVSSSWVLFIYLSFFSSRRETCCKTKPTSPAILFMINVMQCNAIKLDDYYLVQYKYGQKTTMDSWHIYIYTHRWILRFLFLSRKERNIAASPTCILWSLLLWYRAVRTYELDD